MKSINLILLALLCYCNFCTAQTNYLPGYYINKDGETIKGYINYQEWTINPKKVRFAKEEKGKAMVITPETANGFGIDGKEIYVSRTLDINIAPIEIGNLSESKEPVFEKRTVFLRTIVSGTATLYFLNGNTGKDHFFIEKENLPVEELIFIKYYRWTRGRRLVVPLEQYKGQLNTALSDCSNIYLLIKDAGYKSKDLTKIFEGYNECNGENILKYVQLKEETTSEYGLMVGGGLSTLKFEGNAPNSLQNMNFLPNIAYSVGCFAHFNFDRNRDRFAAQFELNYNAIRAKANRETTLTLDQAAFNMGHLQLNILLRYAHPTKGKFRPYLNAGLGGAVLLHQKNSFETENTFSDYTTTREALREIKKYEVPVIIGGFGVMSKKIAVGLRVDMGKRISPYIYSRAQQRAFLATFKYNFN